MTNSAGEKMIKQGAEEMILSGSNRQDFIDVCPVRFWLLLQRNLEAIGEFCTESNVFLYKVGQM